ncbi:NAD(P)H-binding protein [Paenibacillus sp. MMS20-IR301]|uniref:NAD(P)-dependent oxidoreductase n=1 Tax=Paenibacillus sp. MMS20-IR301 TaxID=2895946 RepID=UPI0028E9647E|nr:NAD(P)H-binding protein [Paenibacillus sp. MMS20-IR301]WNS41815.1 NAD(P)H-binding protein [Paenibacillus sp. MMS20-IR301]
MDIVVFGASGRIGSAIVEEALKRKHEVTAAVRNPEAFSLRHDRLKAVAADLLDPVSVAEAVRGHEEVISAFGPAAGHEGDLLKVAESLPAGMRAAGLERLIIVGGAGSLKTESGERLMDTESFPEAYFPLASAHADAYEIYRSTELDYTYLSPPSAFINGRRTGQFRIGLDRLIVDEDGRSSISIQDFAVAVVDELEEGNFSRERFTVGY